VRRLRTEILEETKISVSAGIGPNTRIAKISSNKNKPNGQFLVPNDRVAVMNFMADLPVRKVNGVGRVFERELLSVGINTYKDIFPIRGMLHDVGSPRVPLLLWKLKLSLPAFWRKGNRILNSLLSWHRAHRGTPRGGV